MEDCFQYNDSLSIVRFITDIESYFAGELYIKLYIKVVHEKINHASLLINKCVNSDKFNTTV